MTETGRMWKAIRKLQERVAELEDRMDMPGPNDVIGPNDPDGLHWEE